LSYDVVTIRVKRYHTILSPLTACGCLMVLWISIYPGALQGAVRLAFLPGLLLAPVVGSAALVVLIALRRPFLAWVSQWRRFVIPAAIALVTLALLVGYVPRRIAFAIARPSFQQAVAEEDRGAFHHQVSRWIGPYHIDEQAADERGGVYFRVHSHHVGFIDTASYGFVYQPNLHGSPFGDSGYRLHRMGGEWFWFHAAD